MASSRSIALVLAVVLGGRAAASQGPLPKEVRLTTPSHSLRQEFTRIAGALELPDGRLLVSDRGDERVVVIDLGTGASTPVGRAGSGPAEYRLPGRFIRWPGDSILLFDEGNGRLAVIAPDLRIARSFVLQVEGVPTGLVPRGVDPEGRMYAQVPRWAADGFGKHGDSVPIVRMTASGGRPEIVTWVLVMADPPGKIRRGLPYVPFSPQDVWTSNLSGELAIARSGDYHVEWLARRGLVRGPKVPYTALPVTEKDRIAYSRYFLEHTSIGGRGGANQTPSGLSALPSEMLTRAAVEQLAKENTFAPVRPAFTDEMPLLSLAGQLWVQRSTPDGTPPMWDLFDARGNLTSRVVLPVGRRAIALGRQAVYTLTEDPEGFERVERYSLQSP